jgi:3-oxoadipate enol-lactonase
MPTLRVGDVDLYYEVTGRGQPVLLIHGLGSSSRDWEWQVPALAERYQVITFDVRGHGRSAKPPGPYSIPQFAADTAGLLAALPAPGGEGQAGAVPAHVVGISMGGMIAFQLAVDAPHMVKSLVIVNSGPELVARTFKEKMAFRQRIAIVQLVGMRKMGEVIGKGLFPKPEQAAVQQEFVARWAENDKRAYLCALRALMGWSVADRLGAIDCPALVVSADQDYTPVSAKEAYVARMQRAELVVIPDSHHATPVDQADRLNAAVLDFLAGQESG